MWEAVISGTALLVGGLAWLFRLEGKANIARELAESKHDSLKELINEKFEANDKRLARIERALNGYLRHYEDH